MKNNTKHKITTRKNKPMFHSPFFTLHPSLFTLHPSSFIFHSSFFIILSSLFVFHFSACKDKEPVLPKPDPSNNEYTVKVKIINGTTGKTLYTTSKMHLRIERKYGLGHIDDELLGSAYMEKDGSIEIKYKHSATGGMSGAITKLYGGPWAVGFILPPNKNIDTVLYRSSRTTVDLFIEAKNYQKSDTLVLAYMEADNEHPTFVKVPLPFNGYYTTYRSLKIGSTAGLYYALNINLENFYNYDRKRYEGRIPEMKHFNFTIKGDPFLDKAHLKL